MGRLSSSHAWGLGLPHSSCGLNNHADRVLRLYPWCHGPLGWITDACPGGHQEC